MLAYFKWWYSENLARLWRFGGRFFVFIFDLFSVTICLKTLFAVWRRDQIDTHDLDIKEKLQAWSLNFASRFIGLFIKTITLIVYLITTLLFIAVFAGAVLLYLGFPLFALALLIWGIKSYSEGR